MTGPGSLPRRIVLGGASVHLLERGEIMAEIEFALEAYRPLAVASANLDHVFHFGVNGPVADPVGQAELRWLTLLDGSPLAVRASVLTRRRWARQAGSDLLESILDLAAERSNTVGFLGGTATMHAVLRARLDRIMPGLQVVGYWDPPAHELADAAAAHRLAERVRSAGTDILVVGLGKPRQERWIEQFGLQSGATVLLAFGASADFLAGCIPRAPRVVRSVGMEWAYRLALEPRRLGRRYLWEGPRALRDVVYHSYLPVDGAGRPTRPRDDRRDVPA